MGEVNAVSLGGFRTKAAASVEVGTVPAVDVAMALMALRTL